MKEEKDSLYMPQGIKEKREYFTGYGLKEFKITFISAVLAAFLAGIAYLITRNQVIVALVFLAIPSATVLGVTKDNNTNASVVDLIRFMISFSKTQKYYPYITKDEWR